MKCSRNAYSLVLLALCATALPGCGGSEDANAPPSDRFFRGVFAGNAGDGSANILLFDPTVSKSRGNGSGNVPDDERAVFVELFSDDQAISLTGSWQPNGTLTASGAAPLLVEAERAGLTPRYGCRIGICRTCQCVKLSGTVENLRTGKVSSEPGESVQLCISRARSDLVLDV